MTAQKVDYHQYMASREWALKREAVKERANNTCERCHDAPIQSTHHLTYERLGHEDVDQDLLGICRPCHEFLSARRTDDPAVKVVLDLIEAHGLEPSLRKPGDWSTLLEWSTGPTTHGDYFHGDLKLYPELPAEWVGDYSDAARLSIPLADGIWYHCSSY